MAGHPKIKETEGNRKMSRRRFLKSPVDNTRGETVDNTSHPKKNSDVAPRYRENNTFILHNVIAIPLS